MTNFGFLSTLARRRYEAVAAVCFFTSGFLALAYEICWIRKASLVFGAASFALTTVLAVFFAGLAAGSYWFGRVSVNHGRPLRRYALVESAVAVAAMASPGAFAVADRAFGWFYPYVHGSFVWLSCVRFLFLALIVFPPAALMGATLPLFCRQFVRTEAGLLRSVGLLYGLNTVGALLGCAATGFWLVPTVGVNRTLWWGGAANLLLAAVAWQLPLRVCAGSDGSASAKERGALPSADRAPGARHRQVVLSIAFLVVGFTALGHEVLWARFLSLLIYNTVHTYTLTVTVVLAGIVLGSAFAAITLVNLRRSAFVLGLVQVATGVVVAGIMLLPAEYWLPWKNAVSLGWQLALVALVMLPGAILSGIAFPVAARLAACAVYTTAADVGRLCALTTAGGIFGSLAVGFVSLPLFGMHATALFTTAICVINGLAVWWTLDGTLARRTKRNLSVIGAWLWIMVSVAGQTRLPADFLAPRDRLVAFREGHTGHVAVVRDGPRLRLEVDRLWQGENIKTHQIVAAHLPMLLHDDPRRVLVIGLGPGQTASRFLMYPIERLDCVEIEGAVLPLVRQYFHGAWFDDPRLRFVVEDGRNYVTHTDQVYDVISVEVGQAFRPGVATFYTCEFYERARQRLRAGGLLTQFVSLSFFDQDELRTVIRTFHEVFPETVLCHNREELLLIGKRDGELKLADRRLALLESNSAVKQDLDFRYWGGPEQRLQIPEVFAANLLLGPAQLKRISRGARVYYDDRPFLEYSTSSSKPERVELSTRLLLQHLAPIAELTRHSSLARDAERTGRMESVRQRNLDDLLAEELRSQAQAASIEGDRARAVELLGAALEHNPENLGANLALADTLAAKQSWNEALRYYRVLLKLDETNPMVHLRLTEAWRALGNTWEAEQHRRRAQELLAGEQNGAMGSEYQD